jgi:2-polyprenyl-3-methyl-5-hydroxy-6-metoxy-1,4-benzoquinol methylase
VAQEEGIMTQTLAATGEGRPDAALVGAQESATTEALVDRLFDGTIHALEVASVHLGERLGLYRALAEGVATSTELAARTGCVERYVREWLEQQAAAGFVTVDDVHAEPQARRFNLPEAHRPVFVDEQDVNYLAPLAMLAIGVCGPMDALLTAYRQGGGVAYADYGADIRDGVAALNRPQFATQLGGWLSSIPDVDARLRAAPSAHVADIACGSAWSSIAIARAYPDVMVDAIDVDAASIQAARANVTAAGLSERVRPRILDAGSSLGGSYDLITIFEALHDMNHPVAALRSARDHLADAGSVIVADERVGERFTAPADEIDRFNYGWSILHCLPVGMLDQNSAGTGAVIRSETVRTYAKEAGFQQVEILPIEHEFWCFYRLVP